MEVKFIKSKIIVVCTLLILLVSLSTVVASDVNDVITSTDDGNLKVQSTTNDMEIEQSNNDISNDEQSAGSDMLLASSNEKSYNDDGQDDVLMASANEDVLGAGTFTQLSNLISGSGNNLTLTDDYKHTDYYGFITINKDNWVLDGQGHVIDGNNLNYNIFKLNNVNNITFKNIKFQNVNNNQGSGGVIQFDNNSPGYIPKEVTFENCTFTNCKAINGGVMAINKGIWNITIKNCVFDKYEAEFKGGAFYAENLQNKISCLNIYNSTFSNGIVNNNKQSANGGGAIFLYASCTGNIYSTKFINHTIKDHLHEGMVIRYSGVLNIDGCEFENNKGWDGAVCTGSDTSSATIKNSIFKNNHASRWGGALQIRNALIENCTFINNTAQNGGAIYSRFTIYIKDSKFEDNAATDGGAVNIEKRTTGSVIEGCNFTNNTASRGGAIFSDHAASNQIFSSKFNENKATSLGGAIYLDNEHPGTMEITTSEFVNNDAPAGGAIYDTGNSLKITSSEFVNNTANTTFAGAIYSNDLTIKTSDFIENTAKTYAGAVYAVNSLNIDESNFIKNYADAAGAVFTSYISATFTNFIENHARIAGAVEIDGSSTRTSTISDSEFRDNNATENAGALYWNAAEAIITSTKFISNYAGNDAGAIFWNKGKGTVTRSEFKNNTALGSGGAIYWNSASGTVSSTTFEDNYAKYRGGAIYWHGNSGTVQTSTFKRNSADAEGSVIYWYGNNGLVSGSTFSENPTLLGAVYHHGSNGKIIGNTFNQDKAVYICGHSSATIENNKQNSLNLENYSISTQGNISLNNNEFTNAIHNYGNILTDTTVIVLDNETIITDSKYYDIYTAVLDDNGNYIKLGNDLVNLYENTQQFTATFNNTHYVFYSPYLNLGTHPVTAIGNFTGLQSNVVKSGVLMYMILDVNVTVVNYGEKLIITTTVVNTTENGTITLVINEQVYDNIPLNNGTAVFEYLHALPGTYVIEAYYDVFNQTIDDSVSCLIEARNSTLQISANNITAGQDAIIKINVTNGTIGTVYVFVNNEMYILTLTNSSAQLNITNMPGGIYNIFATYNGDNVFKPSYNSTLLNVSKMTPLLPIIVRNNILVGETVVINVNATSNLTGTITVYVNDQVYVFTRAPVSFTLTNVTAGNYTIRVVYSGDNRYNAANNNTKFIVSKKNINPILTVEDIEVGDNETIIVHVPTNANGIIFLTVNGANYYEYGKDGKATFVLSGLAKGTYNVTAIYLEDNIFYSNSTNASFKVDYVIIDPTITYTVDEDLDVTVNVTVPADANGDIIIEVNGTNYTAHIVKGKFSVEIPGLEGGIYPAKMYFANDTKYHAVNKTFEIQLKKIDTQIHVNAPYIYVGDNATITVTVPGDAGGNVTINVYNANYNETFIQDVINGTAIFTIPGLVYGTYDVKAVFSGDRKYNVADENARFNVRKVDPNPFSYIVAEDIFVGEIATFNITMPNDITAKVNLTIQGQVYTVNVTDGFGQIKIAGLKAGSPVPVTAYFAGNEKYLDCERNYTAFNVHKITNYPVDISATTNSSIADNMTANITVRIAEDANGTGYITINNKTYNITYTNGVANILVDNLTSGRNYTVHAHFNGNDKYSPGDATKTLGGNKTLDYIFNVTAADVFVGNPVYLIIYLPNATAGDFITVVVPYGDYANGILTQLPDGFNGTFSFPVYNLAAGTYENCSVTYHGNSKYEESTRYGIISVSKINVSPIINYNTTYVGQNLTVQITLNPDSNGNVSIEINNNIYNATVENGTAYVVIPNLEAKTYNATLSYSGNEKYNARNQHFDVRVLRIYDYVFELGVVDIFVGDNETITIHLPSDMDVNVTVNIPGTDYTNRSVQLTQGNATIRIPGLSAGTYTVTASITNSSRYLDNSFTRTFTVSPKDDYYFKLDNVTTVFVRDNITFVLHLPDDASGNVTVHIFGENFTGEVNDGVATIPVKANQEGNFPFTISFEEEGKYNYKSQSGYAFVTKKELNLTPIYKGTVEVDEDVIFYFDSLDDATGNITITSRGVPYTAPIINGTAKIVLKGYPLASVYSPAISYTGDDKYYSSRGVATINVVKVSDYEINVTVSNITVDDSEIVNITIPSDATEDVLISGNFSNNTFSVKVNKGNATFVINDLPAGNYTINVRYQGYQKYSDKNVTKTFEVRKVVPSIEIDFVNNNTIFVILPHLANGFANVTIGNNPTKQIEIVNGIGSLDVSYLRPGDYSVNATFLGGARYLENTTGTIITIPKIEDYILPVSAEDIIVGEDSTITVILPEYAEGTVNITIDNGNIIPVDIIERKAIYNATNMGVGTHNVTVSYANDEYVFKTNSTRFTVNKIKTIIDLTVDGNSTNITVTAELTENVTGNVTIVIDGVEYPFYDIDSNVIVLTVGAVPKEHDISVIYSGDENHTDASATTYIETIKESDYSINVTAIKVITVRDNNIITVQLPVGAIGNVHIYINGQPYMVPANPETGKATLELPTLASGNYNVTAVFSNTYYAEKENSTNFTVIKLNTTIAANVNNITKDLDEIINITLNELTSGDVEITIGGRTYLASIDEGLATLTLSNLDADNYTAIITYKGDNLFNGNSTTVQFTVSKIPINITITGPESIVVGQEANFIIETSRPITDLVTVKIGENNYTAVVYNGKGNLTVTHIAIGYYDNVTVIYPGDEDYFDAKNSTKLNVTGKLPTSLKVNVTNITVGESVTIYINATGDVNGTVTILMSGNPVTVQLVNGSGSHKYDNLTARDYHFTVSYFESEFYLSSNTTGDFTVFKKKSNIQVNVSNIYVGEVEYINITISENTSGHVLISFADVRLFADLNGSSFICVPVADLPVGNYNVTVTYDGDENFTGSSNKSAFNITKLHTSINITCNETIVMGYPVEFTFTTSANITEVVTITIGTNNYTTFVQNGKGTFTVYNLITGNYTANITFPGNSKYYGVSNGTKFNVTGKLPVSIYADVKNITLGENATVNVRVNAQNGTVVLVIAGDTYRKDVVNGEVNFTVPDLIARDYHITLTYLENDDYLSNETTANFIVFKKASSIDMNVSNIKVGQHEIINVTVTKGATGIVLIDIAGVKVYAEIDEETGIATATFDDLGVNTYNVTATYMGDNNYNGSSTNKTFNVTKLTTTIVIVTDKNIVIGHPVVFNITTSANVTEVITINVNNKNYTTFIENGKGTYTIYDSLPANNYTATVYFPSDDKYEAVQNETKFTITGKHESAITINVSDVTVGGNVTVYVNVTSGATGKVSLSIYGQVIEKELSNSMANFTIPNLPAREFPISVYYQGDDNYLVSNETGHVTVNKKKATISLNVTNSYVGDLDIINVTVPEGASGHVLITVGGMQIYALINGSNILNVPVSELKLGEYNVTAEYVGDENYTSAYANASFNVTKREISIVINATNIFVEQTEIFNITASENITEVITIEVDRANYTAYIIEGKGTFTVPKHLAVGKYNATVYFAGNTQYDKAQNKTEFEVFNQTVSNIIVKARNITVGENATIYVEVTDGATGRVAIVIAGETHYAELNNSKANFTIPNLIARNYHVTAYYLGNDYFFESENETAFVVNRKSSDINVTANNITVDKVQTININITNGTTGVVLIDINGTNYFANITEGVAKLDINNLAVGQYKVIVKYEGDANYDASYDSTVFHVTKLNSNITVEILTPTPVAEGEAVLIKVTGPANFTGVAILTVSGLNDSTYTVFINNGEGSQILINQKVGNYTVSAVYQENDKYLSNNSNTVTFEVYATSSELNIQTENIYVGDNETIIVTVAGNYSENVTIVIGNLTRESPLVYNSTSNESVAIFKLTDKFEEGIHNVHASFVSNESGKVITHEGDGYFIVSKHNSTLNIAPILDIKVGENVTITLTLDDDATGTVDVYVGGEKHPLNRDNLTLTLTNLHAGHYSVQAIYGGDAKYLASSDDASFNVTKNNADIKLDVSNIEKGQVEYINVTVAPDAEGYVLIDINGTKYYSEIKAGVARFNITDLSPGNYNVNATFIGDNKYFENSTSDSFTVSKLTTTIEINGSDIYYGQDEVFNITTSANLTVVVVIEVNGTNYTTFIENGNGEFVVSLLPVGKHNATVYLAENTDYDSATDTFEFEVFGKKESAVDIKVESIVVGGDVIIEVNVTDGATGSVMIVVAGTVYAEDLNNSRATFTIKNLTARHYHVSAMYFGDDVYAGSENADEFDVVKKNTTISASVTNSTVGSVEYINVTVDANASGTILISVGGSHYYAVIDKGVARFNITGLLVGNYTADITYLGDDYFNNNTGKADIEITKLSTLINITGHDITIGQTEVFTIKTSQNITALVNIEIDGVNYTTFISEGVGTYSISNFTVAKEYTVTVYYLGSDVYFPENNFTSFNVTAKKESDISVVVQNITVGSVEYINVTVSEGVTGNITIIVAGNAYTSPIVGDVAKFAIGNLTARDYHVTAYFFGNEYYLACNDTAEFTVSKKDVTVSATVTNSTVGSIEYVNVTLSDANAKGTILISVGESHYYAVIGDDGVARFNITGLLVGNYTADITYLGDDRFNNASGKVNIKISQITTLINITGHDITAGQVEKLIIRTSQNITSLVTVQVGKTNYTTFISEGYGELEIENLTADTYTATVYYAGSEVFVGISNHTTFIVDAKNESSIEIKVNNITIGDKEIINITVTKGATGNVTIVIAGNEYSRAIGPNGEVTFEFTPALARDYDVTVIYNGDTYYKGSSNVAHFTVSKKPSVVDLNVSTITVGDIEIINVTVTSGATGVVLINVSGTYYYSDLNEGKATFNVAGLKTGEYNATVTYTGDETYSRSVASKTFIVNPQITVEAGNNDGNKTSLTIKVSDNATGNATVIINGTKYNATVKDGVATVDAVGVNPGEQNVTVIFNDGKNTVESNQTVDIPKVTDYETSVNASDIKVGEDGTIIVNVPEDATGNVTIKVGNQTITKPIDNGTATFTVSDLPVGAHDIDVTYDGDDKYASTSTKSYINVGVNVPTINAVDKLVRGWNSIYDYEAVFLDKFGNALEGIDVTFTIDGKTYTVRTEKHGIAKLTTSHLDVGDYNVTSYNPVTKEVITKKLSIVPRLIKNKDITMDFVDGTSYTVLVIGDDGNPVGEGEIIDIYVNTIHYVSKTDENGYARLKINLNPKTYKVTAEYKKYQVKNKLVVKQTFKLVKKTVSVKKGKKLVLKAKLKWTNGKAIKGKVIKFKFRGKTYKAKTNSKGIAQVTIKSQITKKLKKGAKYAYSAKYLTNNIKGKVKVK